MLIKKIISLARLVKNEYEDQLWLMVVVSALLLLLTLAGLSNYRINEPSLAKSQATPVQSSSKANRQISLAQVQAIVTKPMADLIAMQVYDDENHVQNTYELVAQVSGNKTASQHGKNQHHINRQMARLYLSEANLFAVHAYINNEINFKI